MLLEMTKIQARTAVRLEEKRHHVGIDDDRSHAAGSVLLCPRHSRTADRKSSIDSSSGQKLPSSSFGSRGKVSPWAATSSPTEGWPSRTYSVASSSLASFIPFLGYRADF